MEKNLQVINGIKKISGDPYAKTVEVIFEARKMSLRNVEHHIARIGFDVEASPLSHEPDTPYRIPGNSKNKKNLPPECQ